MASSNSTAMAESSIMNEMDAKVVGSKLQIQEESIIEGSRRSVKNIQSYKYELQAQKAQSELELAEELLENVGYTESLHYWSEWH